MESFCVRVRLKENSLEGVKEWFSSLLIRKGETLESLKNEGVHVESVFLDSHGSDSYLIYYMKAEDMDKAFEVFKHSTLPIDVYHKECWKKYCEESVILEMLLDLDRLKEGKTL